MKKRIFICGAISLIIFIAALCAAMRTSVQDTMYKSYAVLREEANEDATTLDLTSEGDYANMPSDAVEIETDYFGAGSGINKIEVVFCGGAAANKTFTYKIYAWRGTNGMARMVATGVGTLGTQAVVIYPEGGTATSKFWADTLTVTTSKWLTPVYSSDESGNNNVASLQIKTNGFTHWKVEITNADGETGSEAGNVTAYYCCLSAG